jgi:MFS family permease
VRNLSGTAWGYIESFLFWLLQDLGALPSLMGITITVGGIPGIPLLVLSGPIIDKIGHANVLFIGFIFYAIRLVGKLKYFMLRRFFMHVHMHCS